MAQSNSGSDDLFRLGEQRLLKLDAELKAIVLDPALQVRIMQLCFEIQELYRALNPFAPADQLACYEQDENDQLTVEELIKFCRDIDHIEKMGNPPLKTELEALAERLAELHQTILPDFEAFYRHREEIERRIDTVPKYGENPDVR